MANLTLGPPRRYAPVCLLEWHGFSGGPVGYREVDETHEGPIIETPHGGDDAQKTNGES